MTNRVRRQLVIPEERRGPVERYLLNMGRQYDLTVTVKRKDRRRSDLIDVTIEGEPTWGTFPQFVERLDTMDWSKL